MATSVRSDDLTTAYMLGVEDMRSKLHKAADEIERLLYENAELREDNKRFYKQAEMNARLMTENTSLRAENEKLRKALEPFAEKYQDNGLTHSMYIFEMKHLLAAKKLLGETDE